MSRNYFYNISDINLVMQNLTLEKEKLMAMDLIVELTKYVKVVI